MVQQVIGDPLISASFNLYDLHTIQASVGECLRLSRRQKLHYTVHKTKFTLGRIFLFIHNKSA